jgi:hypothetical protein
MQEWKQVALLLGLLALGGCDEESSAVAGAAAAQLQPRAVAQDFDASTAGSIRGRVVWKGDLPVVVTFHAPTGAGAEAVAQRVWSDWPNPHAPAVDRATNGIANAVVFLRGVNPRQARPWDLPPVVVEQRDYVCHIRQGESDSPVGFVRRGEAIQMVSRQPAFHLLHAHGAAYFSLAFPDPERPLSRRLPRSGLVELTSAAGYFWMRGYLFVDDQPYFARTDCTGRFRLDAVPPGNYELVCWLPNWHIAKHERDPETALITRIVFQPPVELSQPLALRPTATVEASFTLSADLFAP